MNPYQRETGSSRDTSDRQQVSSSSSGGRYDGLRTARTGVNARPIAESAAMSSLLQANQDYWKSTQSPPEMSNQPQQRRGNTVRYLTDLPHVQHFLDSVALPHEPLGQTSSATPLDTGSRPLKRSRSAESSQPPLDKGKRRATEAPQGNTQASYYTNNDRTSETISFLTDRFLLQAGDIGKGKRIKRPEITEEQYVLIRHELDRREKGGENREKVEFAIKALDLKRRDTQTKELYQ